MAANKLFPMSNTEVINAGGNEPGIACHAKPKESVSRFALNVGSIRTENLNIAILDGSVFFCRFSSAEMKRFYEARVKSLNALSQKDDWRGILFNCFL